MLSSVNILCSDVDQTAVQQFDLDYLKALHADLMDAARDFGKIYPLFVVLSVDPCIRSLLFV